ncbi:MAG: hypothetical protein OEW35_05310 [Gammaproteobacteria bacterium]|nr:hypothetical protein [Gammaproteobacteria bacterium]MDH4253106.1 hypothetical protein [Gammaproteobacteria bacterium]MDH5308932.1 hypothetical protein [Gammaproteobacteria bacterium]
MADPVRTCTLLLASLAAACGPSDDGTAREPERSELAEPMLQSLDKARQVEAEALERKDELDEAMKKAEDGDP